MERRAFHGVMPKTPYYRTNGSGRDMYIAYDNGGTFQPTMSMNSYEKTTSRPRSAVSKLTLRSLHYIADGTGRDSYIKISDGGLHSTCTPKDIINNFKNSLREYTPVKKPTDLFTWTQSRWMTTKERIYSRSANKKVQTCVNRLYRSN